MRSASVDAKLEAAVPTMQIVFFDTYNAAFAALAGGRVDAFLADKMLVLWFAQKSGHAADFALIEDYQLPRTAGFALKKNEPQVRRFRQSHAARSRSVRRSHKNIRRLVRAVAARLSHSSPTERYPAMTAATAGSGMKWVGRAIRRLEDPALVAGRGRFTGDLGRPLGALRPQPRRLGPHRRHRRA